MRRFAWVQQMGLKIIGAGFGRTGTLSLKLALEMLGFDKCYHMFEVYQNPGHVELWRAAGRGEPTDWDALFEGYQAAVDWPTCNFWQDQLKTYPEAKVILSERDPDKWYDSVVNTIYPSSLEMRNSDDPAVRHGICMAFELIWDGIFDGRMDDRAHVIACYEAHNQRVKDTVPAEQLLVFEPGEGWASLCAFLDVPIPDDEYPNTNTTVEFHERQRLRREEGNA
ncbi:MAG: sulfotransferase family protein [Gammaproteobacteria bacterium]|nr:sulfotransferase family protein [Gammaproteobacteria bacterium]